MEKLMERIKELEALLAKAEEGKKAQFEKELADAKVELSNAISTAKEKETQMAAIELENKKLKEKQIDMELEAFVKEGKLSPANKKLAKALMVSASGKIELENGKSANTEEILKEFLNNNKIIGDKPATSTTSSTTETKGYIMLESEVEKMDFEHRKEVIEKIKKKEIIVLPNKVFRNLADTGEFSEAEDGRLEFTDYSTAINQLNTGSYLLPAIWEAKVLMKNEGQWAFRSIAQKATKADARLIQWQVIGTLSRVGSSTGVGTATGTAGMTISQVTLAPQRYGNSVSWTEEVNDWSVTNIENNIAFQLLAEDYRQALDLEAFNVLKSENATVSGNAIICGSWNVRGTVQLGSVGTFNANGVLLPKNVELGKVTLRKNRAKKFGDSYICFAAPEQLYSLQGGTAWIEAAKYADSTKLITGEIGKYMGVRFVDSDTVSTSATQRKTAAGTGTSWTAIMVGAEALGEGFDQEFKLSFYPDDHDDGGYFKRLQWNARGNFCRLKDDNVILLFSTISQDLY